MGQPAFRAKQLFKCCLLYTSKQVLTAPPVKRTAMAHGIPVFQPGTLRDAAQAENIRCLLYTSQAAAARTAHTVAHGTPNSVVRAAPPPVAVLVFAALACLLYTSRCV